MQICGRRVLEDNGRVSTAQTSGFVATDSNIFRLGLTKTGQGARIEAFYRAVPSFTVPGTFFFSISSICY
jgi:hypothetical protein